MDNIPTKEELAAKAEEVHALWRKVLEAKRVAAACEEEFKQMRYQYYANRVRKNVVSEDNHVD